MELKEKAKEYAIKAHGNQIRKSNGKLMIYHPIAVGELLETYGYDENKISAGFLHDTVEDTNTTIDDIETHFGSNIAHLVFNASEPDKSLSWEERKTHTMQVIQNSPIDEIVVVLADKIHNIEDLTNELKIQGLAVFNSFKRGIEKQLWYFDGIYNSINPSNKETPIVKRLGNAISKLKEELHYQYELENVIFSEDKELLNRLRQLHILKYKVKEDGYIKPFIIELLGTPRTGKTSIISNILDFLKRGGFKVTYFKELVTSEFYKTVSHLPLYDRNMAIINEIVKQLKSIIEDQTVVSKHNDEKDINLRVFDNNGDVIVFDRGIYDRLIWFRRLLDNNEITQIQYEETVNQYKEYLNLVSCLLCFTASPEIALRRDYILSLALEKRSFLSTKNIKSYNKAMQSLINDGIITNHYLINTDNQSLTDITIQTTQYVLKKMKKNNN